MNDYEKFLNGCYYAVVKIRRFTDDLYNFVVLMEKLGLNEYIKSFEKTCCDTRTREEKEKKPYCREEDFCEDYFFHLAKINGIKGDNVYIEFQWGKGFTFGSFEDYNAEEVKILSVEDLIKATNLESEFGKDYIETSFIEELGKEDEDFAIFLTDFCEWYEWQLVKYPNLRYNILDLQTNELVGYFGDENTTTGSLKDCIKRVFYRRVDYFTDEEEHEEIKYVKKVMKEIIGYAKKYDLYDETYINYLLEWLEEEKKYLGLEG